MTSLHLEKCTICQWSLRAAGHNFLLANHTQVHYAVKIAYELLQRGTAHNLTSICLEWAGSMWLAKFQTGIGPVFVIISWPNVFYND